MTKNIFLGFLYFCVEISSPMKQGDILDILFAQVVVCTSTMSSFSKTVSLSKIVYPRKESCNGTVCQRAWCSWTSSYKSRLPVLGRSNQGVEFQVWCHQN